MKTEIKVIKALIEHEKKEMTIREIAIKIKSDYKITHTAVQRLIKKGILRVKIVGKSSLCMLNPSAYSLEIYQAEDERKQELLKNKEIYYMFKEIMQKIETSFLIILVFGSYAKKKQTKYSDIDLLFISQEQNFENKVTKILALFPVKTHHIVLSEEDFKRMLNNKEKNVVKETLNNYIILCGIESFYRLKNA